MADSDLRVLYWDASALLSVLIADSHSKAARRALRGSGRHLISSLAFAEVCAVLTRLVRSRSVSAAAADTAVAALLASPWDRLALEPDRVALRQLSTKHSLRGADLWHLATAHTLAGEIGTLQLVTYDHALHQAARIEGLA